MKKIVFIGILTVVLIISLGVSIFLNGVTMSFKESLVNLDDEYLNILPIEKGSDGLYTLPSGYYYVDTPDRNVMAKIPPGYVITSDKRGIITTNPSDLITMQVNNNGTYTVPTGYYQINSNKMAAIPYGFQNNSSQTGITLIPTVNIINKSPDVTSPTANTNDASYNALIKYNSNNFNINYHEDLSFNDQLSGLLLNPIYYEPGTFKYGGSTYVPSYEDSVYLSKTTYQSTVSPVDKPNKLINICREYQYYPTRLENACNNIDKGSCKKSNCCILLGGEKCVAGNEFGPLYKNNYSDFLVKNRDYYYYNNRCYGNCPYYKETNL